MNIAIVLSGGTGSRLGADVPKQYIEVAGKPIITYCHETFERCATIDGIQVVADKSWQDVISKVYSSALEFEGECVGKLRGFSDPGATRQLSILNALEDVRKYASDEDVVIVHDAARPLLSEELIECVIEAVKEHDGAIPVLPMKDTVYFVGHQIFSVPKETYLDMGDRQ